MLQLSCPSDSLEGYIRHCTERFRPQHSHACTENPVREAYIGSQNMFFSWTRNLYRNFCCRMTRVTKTPRFLHTTLLDTRSFLFRFPSTNCHRFLASDCHSCEIFGEHQVRS